MPKRATTAETDKIDLTGEYCRKRAGVPVGVDERNTIKRSLTYSSELAKCFNIVIFWLASIPPLRPNRHQPEPRRTHHAVGETSHYARLMF